jgi:hypothetical protein
MLMGTLASALISTFCFAVLKCKLLLSANSVVFGSTVDTLSEVCVHALSNRAVVLGGVTVRVLSLGDIELVYLAK